MRPFINTDLEADSPCGSIMIPKHLKPFNGKNFSSTRSAEFIVHISGGSCFQVVPKRSNDAVRIGSKAVGRYGATGSKE